MSYGVQKVAPDQLFRCTHNVSTKKSILAMPGDKNLCYYFVHDPFSDTTRHKNRIHFVYSLLGLVENILAPPNSHLIGRLENYIKLYYEIIQSCIIVDIVVISVIIQVLFIIG